MALSLATPWIIAPGDADDLSAAAIVKPFIGGKYDQATLDRMAARIKRNARLTGLIVSGSVAQIGKETAWARFTGDVDATQFNVAGIGTIGGGVKGHSFPDIEAGVDAFWAHHALYHFGDFPNWPAAWAEFKPLAVRREQVLGLVINGERVAGTVDKIGSMVNGIWAWTKNIPLGSLANGYARGIVDIGNTLLGGTTVAVSKPPMQINPSPNRGGYAHPHKPLALVWHITAGTSSLGWLTNPASGASSNYLIDRDGTTHELVPPTASAWANGKSCKPDMGNPIVKACIDGGRNLNTATISIEHEGKSSLGKGGSLTQAQIDATVRLSAWLCATFGIAPDRGHIIKHAQIDACDRPNCPGFSEAEWAAWVGRVAALVGGATPVEGGDVREPAPEQTIAYLNAQGNLIVAVNLGGTATKVLGANVADLGGSVENAKGEQFDRSVQANVFKDWAKRP